MDPFRERTNAKKEINMLFEFSTDIYAQAILFKDLHETQLQILNTTFSKLESSNDDPEYHLEYNGEIVASDGYVWNYNFPFLDIYYEVKENHRRKGFGSLITQELKKQAYKLDRVPAARCNVKNKASQRTLLKAGMQVCGHILIGKIITDNLFAS